MMNRLPAAAFVAAGLAAAVLPARAAELTVAATGIRSEGGVVRFALFDSAAEFPEGEEVRHADLPARTGAVEARFDGLAPGRYAVAAYHDEDGDDEFDTGFFGLPLEGYGFSRDAHVFFGPPGFDAAAVTVTETGARITLRMRY